MCVGSTSCSPAMRNYTVMELELQAIVYAVKKCSVYLLALDAFTIYTDHRDLDHLEDKELVPSANSRLFRNKEYLLTFPLKIRYLQKEKNLLADWLSRKPQSHQEAEHLPRFEGTIALVYEGAPLDRKVLDTIECAVVDNDYSAVVEVLNEGTDLRGLGGLGDDHPAKVFKSVWPKLSVFNGPNGQVILMDNKLVIPKALRNETLQNLHQYHPSGEVMWMEAREKVWWPGIRNEIMNYYIKCPVCTEIQRMCYEPPPIVVNQDLAEVLKPMDELRVDWGSAGSRHFHIVVDLATSYLWVREFQIMSTENSVLHLEDIMG